MLARIGRVVTLFLSVLLLPAMADAQDQSSFEGTFKNDDVSVTLKKAGDDNAYAGTITASGQEMPIESATAQGGTLKGSFKSADGEKFPFTLALKDGKAELTSEEVVQQLERVAAKANPLARPKAANPLAHGTTPAKPNPLAKPIGGDTPAPATPVGTYSDDPADMPAVRAVSAAMDANDYAKAWSLVKPLVDKGNVRGLFLAGLMYQNGYGVAVDGVKATESYERSGAGGFSYAWDNLGMMYRDGRGGVKADVAKAMDYFAKGVRLGNNGSALSLGALHANGQGTPRDFVKACAYYHLSDTNLARKNKAELEGYMKPEEIAKAKALSEQIRAERQTEIADGGDDNTPKGPGGIPVTFVAEIDGNYVVKTAPAPDNDNDPFNDPPFSMLKPGDVLLEVDGKPVKGLSKVQLDALLAGEAGSSIQISLKRPGEDGGIQIAAPRVPKAPATPPK